ncbi:heptaprenyl diphosphate synthase component 1 [Cytobacillus sp. FJAT-54145]|uniref:Heptaprenyl diphosphate synthase component 1 n=1 Tax=Cytobacillus spartinae TaxID=3299023 RepID=A0ABW6KDC3_9BACI
MIILQDIQKKLANVREIVEGRINHPYLFQHIQAPIIDEDKLLFLVSILNQLDLSKDKTEAYIISTMLIQIALDTHDHVRNTVTEDETQKSQQLTVLAGDYYSGLYYKILAESEDIDLIRILSEGTKNINDHKISFYQQDAKDLSNLMESLKTIESNLLEKLTSFFQVKYWDDVVVNFLLIKRLLSEREMYLNMGTSNLFEALMRLTFPKHNRTLKELSIEQKNYLVIVCDRYIDFSRDLLNRAKSKIPFLNELVDERISKLLGQTPVAKTFAEEG